jgi:AcrR family transcriptional regulator
LLDAARTLFAQRGYDRTTLRQVAEQAGVDAALVARYFGGKEGLYLAVFSSERLPEPSGDARDLAERLLRRWDEAGPGPMVQALLRPELDESIRRQMLELNEERMVGPVVAELEAAGIPQARLRAELLMASLTGVGVIRAAGSLSTLSAVSRDELLELLRIQIDALVVPPR